MTLTKVAVRRELITQCPHGGSDRNTVTVSWAPRADQRVDAEDILSVIQTHSAQVAYCESLAELIAQEVWEITNQETTVLIEQEEGHGVSVEAVYP